MNGSPSQHYEIRIRGHLAPRRLCCLGNLAVTHHPDGDTMIVGDFRDQAALHGLLSHIRNLGITLVSVNRVAPPDARRSG